MALFRDYPLNLVVPPGQAIRRNVADTAFETFDTTAPGGDPDWADIQNKPATFPPSTHNHDAAYEAKNTNIQTHISSSHAPANAQKNSDITKAEIEAKLTGAITTHTHDYAPTNHNHDALYAPNASYRTLLDSSGSHIAGRVAGTYGMAQGQPLAITGVGTLYALNSIFISAADFPASGGLATKLRIRAQLYTNDVVPFVGTFTIGLRPITRPATSGGAGLCIYTIGAAVAGSTLVFTNAPVDALLSAVGTDFALPADGHYIIGVVTTATMAANSHAHISASLQMRNA